MLSSKKVLGCYQIRPNGDVCTPTVGGICLKINLGVITLLPKKEDASHIDQYRPLCKLNVSIKIFTKFGTNQVTGLAKRFV
jgi:hypothetical protein